MPHTASLDPTLTFDFDEKLDNESDIGDAKHHPDTTTSAPCSMSM